MEIDNSRYWYRGRMDRDDAIEGRKGKVWRCDQVLVRGPRDCVHARSAHEY
jgi:hypothetical protein